MIIQFLKQSYIEKCLVANQTNFYTLSFFPLSLIVVETLRKTVDNRKMFRTIVKTIYVSSDITIHYFFLKCRLKKKKWKCMICFWLTNILDHFKINR